MDAAPRRHGGSTVAALAGAIFGAILSHSGSFTPNWAVCTRPAFARLALLFGLAATVRAGTARQEAE
jgi:hypothetical protein